ncbi:MAG: hypothetical protein IJW71_05295 [Clostridia bacterium]|nr:hypothetical protein [Clostridia bacterium]
MRENIILHLDARDQLALLSDADRGRLLLALFAAAAEEPIPALSPPAEIALAFLMQRMRYDTVKYEQICAKKREKAVERWKNERKRTASMPLYANGCNGMDTDTDTGTDTDRTLSPPIAPAGGARVKGAKREEPPEFAAFLAAYPKKINRDAARTAYAAARARGVTHEEILAGLSRAKSSDSRFLGDPRYIPTAAKWLDSEGYRDEHAPPSRDRLGNFDTDEVFNRAVERSYQKFKEQEKEGTIATF